MERTAEKTVETRRMLRASEIGDILRMSPRTIYRLADQGHFPAPVRIGPRSVRWRLEDVLSHIDHMHFQFPELPEQEHVGS